MVLSMLDQLHATRALSRWAGSRKGPRAARPRAVWLVAIAFSILVTACGQSTVVAPASLPTLAPTLRPAVSRSTPNIAAFPTLELRHEDQASLTALGLGELREVDGCLRLARSGNGPGEFIVWPNGFRPAVEDGRTVVLDPQGLVKARVGEKVRMAGGHFKDLNLSEEERERLPSACPGPYFEVHEIESR